MFGWLAADLVFDGIQRSDTGQGFGGGGRGVDGMDLVELAPGVRPAGDLVDAAVSIKMVEACVMCRIT